MNQEILKQAVLNNAQWCEIVSAAHGVPGEFRSDVWINHHQVPPFYPNVISLSENVPSILESIQGLVVAGSVKKFGVKDSFSNLDLTSLGFSRLFGADWIYLPADSKVNKTNDSNVIWNRVKNAEELKKWEIAWNDGEEPAHKIFLPSLLENADVIFFMGSVADKIVAGGVANKSTNVVGISNIFAPHDNQKNCWEELLYEISAAFPGFPIVGYESDSSLDVAKSIGFESIGTLQIWEN